MAFIFISHSSKDNEYAEKFKKRLKANEIESTFLDIDEEKGIKVGEHWEKRLYAELDKCHVVVLLLSPHWIASKWCFAEYTQARALGKEIIPIIIDHGENNEVDNAISNYIQNHDLTQNPNVEENTIKRIKEVSLDVQRGFEWDIMRDPYPGMVSFDKEDAAIFFGRETESKEIIEKLTAMRNKNTPKLLTIIATSGMGKSSLLKAGVIATLELTYAKDWKIFEPILPSKKPLIHLAKQLATLVLRDKSKAKELYGNLKSKEYKASIDNIFEELEFASDELTPKSILIPIDQAEEFYVAEDTKEIEAFLKVMAYLLLKDENIFSVWTLRSDFLKHHQTSGLTQDIRKKEDFYTLSPMSKESIATIINKPAEVASVGVEEALIERIKTDIQTSDALPLLAITLHKLYISKGRKDRYLSLLDYESLAKGEENTISSIIKNIADEALQKFSEKEIAKLKDAFIPHLVGINSENELIKKSTAIGSLSPDTHTMIEELTKARLLLKDEENISIAHEALLRHWELLQKWIDEEKEFLIFRSQLRMFYDQWVEVGRSDKALLSGLNLEKAINFIDKIQNKDHIGFIDKSLACQKEQEKKYKELYDKAQEELEKANHNIGLALIEKSKNFANNKVSLETSLLGYEALTYLKPKLDKTDAFSEVKNIIYQNQPLYVNYTTSQGNDDYAFSAAILSDGSKIASCSSDKTIKLWDSKSGDFLLISNTHEDYVHNLIFSPDSSKIASCSSDKTIKIWDIKSGNLLQKLNGYEDDLHNTIFSPDSTKVISGSKDKTIKIWNVNNGELLRTLSGHKGIVFSIDISFDGKKVVSGSQDKTIKIWDTKTGNLIRTLKGHKDCVNKIVFCCDGTKIISSSFDSTIKIWDVNSGELLRTLIGHKDSILSMAISSDGRKVVSGSRDKTIKIWDRQKGKLIKTLKGHKGYIVNIIISPDGRTVVSNSMDSVLKIWKIDSGELLQTIVCHTKSLRRLNNILSVVLFEDGTKIAAAFINDSIKIWKKIDNKFLQTLKVENHPNSAMFLPNRTKIISALWDSSIKIWNVDNGELLHTLSGHKGIVFSIDISSDGKKVVSGSQDKTIKIWDLNSGELLSTLSEHEGAIHSIVFSPDGTKIISGSDDTTIKIWDTKTGNLVRTLTGYKDSVSSVACSPDGLKIASSSSGLIEQDGEIRLWDFKNGNLIRTLVGHKGTVNSIVFSFDGSKIISGSWDYTIKIWDTKTGNLVRTLIGHKDSVSSVACSPDGLKIASCSSDDLGQDRTIKIWDIKSGVLLQTLSGHKNDVTDVDFSSDGKKIISCSYDNTIKIWDISKLNDKSFIKNKIKEFEDGLKMKVEGVKLMPLNEETK